jgi:Domain of unknown function (DUF1990)
MSRRVGLARRVGTVARWPVGMGLASWRYLWRTSPLHRVDEQGAWEQDLGPALPAELVDGRMQRVEDGAGPLFHRRYGVRIEGGRMTPEQLVATIAENPNRAAPVEVAIFRRLRGSEGQLRVGDEYLVRMPGPWDGPVRVVARTPTSFRFATLRGHLEAGQIEFRACAEGAALCFEIESWARSGDRLAALLYDRVRLIKEMQLHMWIHFCERVGRLTGGRVRGGVHVRSRRVAQPAHGG